MCTPLRANSLSFSSAFSTCYNDPSGFLYFHYMVLVKVILKKLQILCSVRQPHLTETCSTGNQTEQRLHLTGKSIPSSLQVNNTRLWIRPLCPSSYHNAFVLSIDGDTRRPDLSHYKVELPPPWLLGHHYLIRKMAKMSSRHVYKLSETVVYF